MCVEGTDLLNVMGEKRFECDFGDRELWVLGWICEIYGGFRAIFRERVQLGCRF